MEYSNFDLVTMGVAVVLITIWDSLMVKSVAKRGRLQSNGFFVIYSLVSSLVSIAICILRLLANCEFSLRIVSACVLQGLICGAGVTFAVLLYHGELHRKRKE